MTAYANVNGNTAIAMSLHVPQVGPWWCDVTLAESPELSGAVTVGIGALELSGTVDPYQNGTFGLQRKLRVIAGGGGWGTLLRAKHYHNDAQLRARTIVEDACREAGETLGDFTPAVERIGVDYVRQAGPASRVIEDVIGAVPWHVGYDGRTNVGARASSDAAAGTYEILDFEPGDLVVTLIADDPRSVVIGSVLSQRLDGPQTVRELTIEVTSDTATIKAWCGGGESSRGRLTGLLRDISRRAADDKLFGLWRYRVVQMSGDRVELQAIRRDAGLPDVLPVSMVPGLAGAHAALTPGAEVLVEFVEGNRQFPIVTHFAGKDGNGWAPSSLTLDASTEILLGASASNFVALANLVKARLDTIQSSFDAHTHLAGALTSPSGAVTGSTGIPGSPIGTLAAVAASKVKAQ